MNYLRRWNCYTSTWLAGGFILLSIGLSSFRIASAGRNIEIRIENIKHGEGTIFLCLSTKEDDFMETCTMTWKVPITNVGTFLFVADGIPDGQYAISAFHDLNGNERLDEGKILRIPREPFGFSGNPRIIFGAPSFVDCTFTVDKSEIDVILVLKEI